MRSDGLACAALEGLLGGVHQRQPHAEHRAEAWSHGAHAVDGEGIGDGLETLVDEGNEGVRIPDPIHERITEGGSRGEMLGHKQIGGDRDRGGGLGGSRAHWRFSPTKTP